MEEFEMNKIFNEINELLELTKKVSNILGLSNQEAYKFIKDYATEHANSIDTMKVESTKESGNVIGNALKSVAKTLVKDSYGMPFGSIENDEGKIKVVFDIERLGIKKEESGVSEEDSNSATSLSGEYSILHENELVLNSKDVHELLRFIKNMPKFH